MTGSLKFAGGALAALILVWLAACSSDDGARGAPEPPMPKLPPAPVAAPRPDPAALANPRLDGVIVAGDAERSVHDDTVLEIKARLEEIGLPIDRVHTFSASPAQFGADIFAASPIPGERHPGDPNDPRRIRKLPGATDPATPAFVLTGLLGLDGRGDGACFVMISSVADEDGVKLRKGALTPAELDRALAGGCADAPTVVVISACGSGKFAEAPMARANRLILTAAPAGKTGFGCGPNVGFTTFDECFIGALDGAPTWAAIFQRTQTCVRRREALVEQPDIAPEIAIGALVAALPAPWRDARAAFQFRNGVGRFTVESAPYFPVLRQRAREVFDGYRHAPAPKALALTLAGTARFAAGITGLETGEDVTRIALERCEWQSAGACVLWARDEVLSAPGASGQPPIHPAVLRREGALTAAAVPFIRDNQRGEIAAYLRLPGPKALAVGPENEALGYAAGTDTAAARAEAVRRCGPGCVIYAEADRIVLGWGE